MVHAKSTTGGLKVSVCRLGLTYARYILGDNAVANSPDACEASQRNLYNVYYENYFLPVLRPAHCCNGEGQRFLFVCITLVWLHAE